MDLYNRSARIAAYERFRSALMSGRAPGSRRIPFAAFMQVSPGESLLIAGASGAGKTSTLRAIAGLWSSGSGTIRRHGRPVSAGSGGSGDIFFVPQVCVATAANGSEKSDSCSSLTCSAVVADLNRFRTKQAHASRCDRECLPHWLCRLFAAAVRRAWQPSGQHAVPHVGRSRDRTRTAQAATATSHRQAAVHKAATHSPVSTQPLRPSGALTERRLPPMAVHPAPPPVDSDPRAMFTAVGTC